METGSIILSMVMFGTLVFPTSVLIARGDTGCGPMNTSGCGCPITTGVGLLSTMAVGFMMICMDGFGYPDMNGRLRGWNGAQVVICLLYTSPSPRDRQKSR